MRVFIELPSWLGDAVMSTVAIENIARNHPDVKFTFFGAKVGVEALNAHPNCENSIIDESKKQGSFLRRILWIYRATKGLSEYDAVLSFRSHFASKFLLFCLKARQKALFKYQKNEIHQAKKYLDFVNSSLNLKPLNDEMKLHFTHAKYEKPTLGLNPGASYGSAKRWKPEYFAAVASELAVKYDIVIFGSASESEICAEISRILSSKNIAHTNLCAQTSIKELCSKIAALSLFITNDSGPMHIASAFKVPLIAIFGPTNYTETCPYKHENSRILRLDLPCSPCMKRTCPLGHHKCMDALAPQMVLEAINKGF